MESEAENRREQLSCFSIVYMPLGSIFKNNNIAFHCFTDDEQSIRLISVHLYKNNKKNLSLTFDSTFKFDKADQLCHQNVTSIKGLRSKAIHLIHVSMLLQHPIWITTIPYVLALIIH